MSTGGQLELIHLDRSPPSSVAVLLRLPEGNARSFVVASALGRFFDHDGSFKEVRSLKEIAGSFVGPKQRERVLQALRIKERRWQQLITDWESRYAAHRCGPGGVALFARPLLDCCPVCNVYIEVTEMAPDPAARRKRSGTARQSATVLRSRRTNTTRGSAQTVRPVGTEPAHPISGDLLGDRGRDRELELESSNGKGRDGCPECFSLWAFGHADGCSRSPVKTKGDR
jgi:hypothetical protein